MFDGRRNRTKIRSSAMGVDDVMDAQQTQGNIQGIKRTTEEALDHPLQLIICTFHLNGLPLKHVFE